MLRRLYGHSFFRSIRFQIPSLLILICILSIPVIYLEEKQALRERLETQTQRLLADRAALLQGILEFQFRNKQGQSINTFLGGLAVDPLITLAVVIDEKGIVLGATQNSIVGKPLLVESIDPDLSMELQPELLRNASRQKMELVLVNDHRSYTAIIAPIKISPYSSHDVYGNLLIYYDFKTLFESETQNIKHHTFIYFILFVVISMLVAWIIDFLISRPLRRLAEYMLRYNDTTTVYPGIPSIHNEVREISLELVKMIQKVKESRERDEKARLAAERNDYLKSQFLANMSHEIRTPLHCILGNAELLLESRLNSDQEAYAKSFLRAGENLLAIVSDILDFSKIEAGQVQLEVVDFDLEGLIGDLRTIIEPLADEKKLNLEFHIAPNLPPIWRGDRFRVKQILLNLCTNAIKFTSTGWVKIGVDLNTTLDRVGRIKFAIEDSGKGIAPEYLSDLFKPFSQEDIGQTRRQGGSGLGLSICDGFIKLIGGGITVKSEIQKGTLFEVTLNLEPLTKSKISNGAAGLRAGPSKLDAFQFDMLLVDDSKDNRRLVQAFLKNYRCKIIEAENGAEAIKCVEQRTFDLILMDVQMPEMDGYSAIKRIREYEKRLGGHMPIITLTASALADDVRKSADAGADLFVSKPISKKRLVEAIESVLLLRNRFA